MRKTEREFKYLSSQTSEAKNPEWSLNAGLVQKEAGSRRMRDAGLFRTKEAGKPRGVRMQG